MPRKVRRSADIILERAEQPSPEPPRQLTEREAVERADDQAPLQLFVGQLRRARKDAGLTLAEVAARTGLRTETLSRLETGAVPNPTFSTLAAYAAAVGRKVTITAEPLTKEDEA
jgi:DNA-binding XRE family transcriptional regulator